MHRRYKFNYKGLTAAHCRHWKKNKKNNKEFSDYPHIFEWNKITVNPKALLIGLCNFQCKYLCDYLSQFFLLLSPMLKTVCWYDKCLLRYLHKDYLTEFQEFLQNIFLIFSSHDPDCWWSTSKWVSERSFLGVKHTTYYKATSDAGLPLWYSLVSFQENRKCDI